MKIGDTVTYQAEPGQTFGDGGTTAPAVVQEVDESGGVHLIVTPEGGYPFAAFIPAEAAGHLAAGAVGASVCSTPATPRSLVPRA